MIRLAQATFNRLIRIITETVEKSPLAPDEKLRLKHFSAFVFLGIPTLIGYGVYNFLNDQLLTSSLIFLCSTGLFLSWVLLCYLPLGRNIYRLNLTFLGGLLVYMMVLGGDDGSKSLWLFIFPQVAMFWLGKSEGLAWAAGILVVSIIFLTTPQLGLLSHHYGNQFIIRLISVYLFVMAVAYWFEYFREHYRRGMETEEQRLRAVISAIPDAIALKDNEGRYVLSNQYFSKLTGLSEQHILGKRDEDIFSQNKAEKNLQSDLALQSGKGLVRIEETVVGPAGQHTTYDTIKTLLDNPLNNPAGTSRSILSVSRDITSLQFAEKALHESHKQMLTILDSMDAHIYILNIETYKILYMNHNMKEAFGRGLEGQTCWKVLYNETAPCAHCTIPQLSCQNGAPIEMVEREAYNPITKRWYAQRNRMILWIDQQPVKLQIAFDITRVKQLETARRSDERSVAEAKKQEALGRMAGAIAHHFNNQLMGVLGYLELAMQGSAGNSELHNLLQAAAMAAKKTSKIGGILLCYLGQKNTEQELLDLSEICRQHLPSLQQLLPATITLDTELTTPQLIISCDATLVQQIITHLITNSCEALGTHQGRIALSVTPVSIDSITHHNLAPKDWQATAEDYCCLQVTDTGCGIAEDNLEKIFDPFFTTKFTGRGLGLPMVLGLIKTWGGAINVESTIGQGTTFQIFFPLVKRVTKEKKAMGDKQKNLKVLLIDDDQMIHSMVSVILENLGFTALLAEDGPEGIKIFQEHTDEIALVLCDLIMPQMDGWQTLSALRAINPTIKVIMVSGYDHLQGMRSEYPDQPQAFLNKPYKKDKLGKMISELLGAEKHGTG